MPENIIQLTKLEELDVRDNLLKQIPAALAALPLKALRLCGNPLAGAPRGLADRFTERCRAAGRGLPALAETLLAGPRWRVIAAGSDQAAAAWLDECRRECKPGSFPLDDGVAAPATLKALLSLGLHAGKCVDARDFVYLAQDLVNMDCKHGGGQAKGAKVQANREQVARAQDGQITPGCFEIQDTRAWCTQTPVLARSTVTHRDACARVCVCPACGPRA